MKLKKITLIVVLITLCISPAYSERVISLSPSITEILFELGKGDLIAGNTRFCNYPPQSLLIKKIGGYLDINMEMIIELKPDIIFHYPEHYRKVKKLEKYADLVQLEHKNINDLTNSIETISDKLGISEKGRKLTRKIAGQLNRIKNIEKGTQKKRVVIIIGRDPGRLRNITIIGKGDFLNEIIMLSGGINAYKGNLAYPSVSIESLIKMDPELIIEFSFSADPPSEKSIKSLWNKFPYIKAVNSGNIKIVSDDYWVRPGPRIGRTAESMYKMLYGEI